MRGARIQAAGPFDIQPANSDYLDINNVSALITANSDFGTDGTSTKYFLPKNQNMSPLGRASLWMGGYHNGMLRMAAMTYRQHGIDFWPGPLDTTTATADTATAIAFNRVWKVNRFDIANFIYNWNNGGVQNDTYLVPPVILNWPAHGTGNQPHNLAPYVDVNNNGIYDPVHEGDYPLMKGDQMIWWVFNDKVGKHGETTASSMGIQVNASAYAFVCPNIADSNKVLNNTTFYNYKITNYSPDKLDSFYISPWVDTDLGWYLDDYIGCDVMNNFGFAYNGDNYDEDGNGLTGYHTNLPAFSCNILSGPVADSGDGLDNDNNGIIDEPNEKCLMHTFSYDTNTGDPQTGNPGTMGNGIQYYNLMRARWRNGTPMTYGANGTVQSNQPCRHAYPGNSDPYGISFGGSISQPMPSSIPNWTEYSAGNVEGDRRFIIGVGPFTMQSGKTYELDYALVFSQDSAACAGNNICPISVAQNDNARIRRWFNNNSFPSCLSLQGVGIKNNAPVNTDVKLYPSPATSILYVDFTSSVQRATIEVYDLLGNIVWAGTFHDGINHAVIPVSGIANGVYLVKLNLDGVMITKKFIKE